MASSVSDSLSLQRLLVLLKTIEEALDDLWVFLGYELPQRLDKDSYQEVDEENSLRGTSYKPHLSFVAGIKLPHETDVAIAVASLRRIDLVPDADYLAAEVSLLRENCLLLGMCILLRMNPEHSSREAFERENGPLDADRLIRLKIDSMVRSGSLSSWSKSLRKGLAGSDNKEMINPTADSSQGRAGVQVAGQDLHVGPRDHGASDLPGPHQLKPVPKSFRDNVLEAVEDKEMKGPELALKSGYSYDYFRRNVPRMVGQDLDKTRNGYRRKPK